jgi:hypothetical protein
MAGRHQHQFDRGLHAERVEIVEIRDPGDNGDGDLQPFRTNPAGSLAVEIERILGGEPSRLGQPREHPDGTPAGAVRNRALTFYKKRNITPELVDEKCLYARTLGWFEHGMRPDEARDHAATIDVACQHDGDVGGLRETHIGDVAGPQVDLGRAACPLDKDEVRAGRDARETVQHRRHELGLA